MEDRWDEKLRSVQAEVDRALNPLVRKYGLEAVVYAAANYGWSKTVQQSRKAGRPKQFGYVELFHIWMFVRQGTVSTGLSVREFCRRHSYSWSGIDRKQATITGASLSRRYYQAEAFLKAESEREKYAGPVAAAVIPSTSLLWEQALAHRLGAASCAEINGDGNPLFPRKRAVLSFGSPHQRETFYAQEKEA